MDIETQNKVSNLDTRLTILERVFAKYETENSNKLQEIKEGQDKLNKKIDELTEKAVYSQGFIKATLFYLAGIGVILGLMVKFIH